MKKMLLVALCALSLPYGYAQAESDVLKAKALQIELQASKISEKNKQKLDIELQQTFGDTYTPDRLAGVFLDCHKENLMKKSLQEAEECVKVLTFVKDVVLPVEIANAIEVYDLIAENYPDLASAVESPLAERLKAMQKAHEVAHDLVQLYKERLQQLASQQDAEQK